MSGPAPLVCDVGRRQIGMVNLPRRNQLRGEAWLCGHLRRHLGQSLQADPFRDLRAAPIAADVEHPVGGDDQPFAAGFLGALGACEDVVAAAEPVDLEENLVVDGGDLFNRLAGEETRQTHRRTAVGGRAGHCDLTVRVDRLHTGRRDDHRERDLFPITVVPRLRSAVCTHHVRRPGQPLNAPCCRPE